MDKPGSPEHLGEGASGALTLVPPMPVPASHELASWPVLFVYSRHPSVGWQSRPAAKGGPCFLVGRETAITGSLKVLERFPLTEEGWTRAWRYLLERDKTLEAQLRDVLAARASDDAALAALAELDRRSV